MIAYKISPSIMSSDLNELFAKAWDKYEDQDHATRLSKSEAWICAFDGDKLVGFVKLIWGGGVHGFILDTTTHPEYQRRGIGAELLSRIASVARGLGIEWLHADFEPHLQGFYRAAGYRHTEAGVLNLKTE